jgi:hypothetical protein
MEHPGPWQLFTKRSDNRLLDVMQCKSKYILEEANFFREAQLVQALQNSPKGPRQLATNGEVETQTNNYVDDTYIDDYFI